MEIEKAAMFKTAEVSIEQQDAAAVIAVRLGVPCVYCHKKARGRATVDTSQTPVLMAHIELAVDAAIYEHNNHALRCSVRRDAFEKSLSSGGDLPDGPRTH